MGLLPEGFLDLRGRVALVTGAGQGVGERTARYLAGAGARVVVNDVHADRAERVAGGIRDQGGSALGLRADVSDLAQVEAMVRTAEAEFGRVDVLVNNAGNAGATGDFSSMATPFWETDPAQWPGWFDVNLTGVMNCCKAVLPGMVAAGHGRIVTVVSDAGRVGEAGLAPYAAAKAGAAGFVRSLARAVGRHGITANCLALGTIRDPDRPLDPREERQLRRYPLGRFGRPDDVAGVVLLLASEAGSWITGQTVPVNGGYSFAL